MKYGLIVLLFSCMSLSAFASDSTSVLKVDNNGLAQAGLIHLPGSGSQPRYFQNGQLVTEPSLDGDGYCITFGTNFQLDPAQAYKIKTADVTQIDVASYEIDLTMETHSTDPKASFNIDCRSKDSSLSMANVKAILKGAYEINP